MRLGARLNERLGQGVRDAVLRDLGRGRAVGPVRLGSVPRLAAAGIVAGPYAVGALGLAGLAAAVWVPPLALPGGLLLAMAAYLRPRSPPSRRVALRRPDAPALFALLDRIAAALGAPGLDGVVVTGTVNAFVAEDRGAGRLLGIGAPLWLALGPDERLALLAHEVAHLVNDDPARGRLAGAAFQTMARWVDLVTPPALVDRAAGLRLVVDGRGVTAALLGGAVESLALAFERLLYADSQRAEYLADLLAARVAGGAAVVAALDATVLAPLAHGALATLHVDGARRIEAFAAMARAIREPDAPRAARLRAEASGHLHSVDASHPPTRFRVEVVRAAPLAEPALAAGTVDWARIDAELAPAVAAAEARLLDRLLVQ